MRLDENDREDQEKMNTDFDQENFIKPKNLICIWISRDPYSDKSILDYSLDQSQVIFFKYFK